MSISPISASFSPAPITPVRGAGAAEATGAAGTGIVGQFGQMLEGVSASLEQSDELAKQLATGELTDIHQLTAAAAKAEIGTQMTVAFRDRAVEAFQQIMNMPI
jgi:flagellar hook-basal body complex protein FliE